MARETINGISVPISGTGEPADFVGDLRQIATDLPASITSRVAETTGRFTIDPAWNWSQFVTAINAELATTATNVIYLDGTVPDYDNNPANMIGGSSLLDSGRILDFGNVTFPNTASHLVLKNITVRGVRYVHTNASGVNRSWFILCPEGRVVIQNSLIYVASASGARQYALIDVSGAATVEMEECFLVNHAEAGAYTSGEYFYVLKGVRRITDCFIRLTSDSVNPTLCPVWVFDPVADSWGITLPATVRGCMFSYYAQDTAQVQTAIYYDGTAGRLLTTGNVLDIGSSPAFPVNPYPTQPA